MKTKLIGAALAASLLMTCGAASAENWKTIDETSDGTIVELDMDTIHRNADGSVTVTYSTGLRPVTVFFDCKGHYRSLGLTMTSQLIHIPTDSIMEEASEAACKT